jgi:hypothetical protein
MMIEMRKVTRVTVVEEWTDPATGETHYDTTFEAASKDSAQLARFVPAEVAAALGAPGAAVTIYPPRQDEADEAAAPEEDERSGGYQGDPVPAEVQSIPDARPKRARRTKAEKAADDAAQELGYRDRFHRAEAEQAAAAGSTGEGPTGNGDADLAAAAGPQAGHTTPDGPVAESAPAGVPDAPYNPFA